MGPLSREALRHLAVDTAFLALWEKGGQVESEIASLRRQLEDDAPRDLIELTRLRARLAGIEFVRSAVVRGAASEPTPEKVQPKPRAERFFSRFLPRPLGG